jgi:hypothetical protein
VNVFDERAGTAAPVPPGLAFHGARAGERAQTPPIVMPASFGLTPVRPAAAHAAALVR